MSAVRNQKAKAQNIKVIVRIRPFNTQEKKLNCKKIVHFVSSKEVSVNDKVYQFDSVISEKGTQLNVYKAVVEPMIQDVLCGYNCTVFAYGQTGSGKTFTMSGGDTSTISHWEMNSAAGCIPRAASNIFEQLRSSDDVNMEYTVTVSYIELYNEEVRDLLTDNDQLPPLNLFSDPRKKGCVCIENLKEVTVCDQTDVYNLLELGRKRRQTAATLLNEQSSRSHSVFTIMITKRETLPSGENLCRIGKLNLVDLAGSENIARAGAKELRVVELSNINKSLLTLSRVIHALTEKANHIPYRESKLTRILQDSLGGTTKTCIIANVAPGDNFKEQTLNTLDYAHRAQNITNLPEINQKQSKSKMLTDLNIFIEKLEREVSAARSKYGFFVDFENYEELITDLEKHKENVINARLSYRNLSKELEELEDCKEHLVQQWNELQLSFEKTKENLLKYKQKIRDTTIATAREDFIVNHFEEQQKEMNDVSQNLLITNEQLVADQKLLHEKINKVKKIGCQNYYISSSTVKNTLENLAELSDRSYNLRLVEQNLLEHSYDNVRLITNLGIKEVLKDWKLEETEDYPNISNVTEPVKSKYDIDVRKTITDLTNNFDILFKKIEIFSPPSIEVTDFLTENDKLCLEQINLKMNKLSASYKVELEIEQYLETKRKREQTIIEILTLNLRKTEFKLYSIRKSCEENINTQILLSTNEDRLNNFITFVVELHKKVNLELNKTCLFLSDMKIIANDFTKQSTEIIKKLDELKRIMNKIGTQTNKKLSSKLTEKIQTLSNYNEKLCCDVENLLVKNIPAVESNMQIIENTNLESYGALENVKSNIENVITNEYLKMVQPVPRGYDTPDATMCKKITEKLQIKSKKELEEQFKEIINCNGIELNNSDVTTSDDIESD